MASLLAPGAKAPTYALVRPKTAAPNSLWSGTSDPGAGWVGTGGGWWTPPASYKPPVVTGNPGSAVSNLAGAIANTPSPTNPTPTYSATTVAPAAAPPAAPAPNALDSTYLQNVANSRDANANTIAALNKSLATGKNVAAQSDYTDAVNNPELAHQYALDQLAARVAASRSGGLDSTGLATDLAKVTQGYQDKYTAAQTTYQQLADQIAGQIAQANYGESQYEGGQLEDATNRASALAQANPALGESTAPLAMAPATIKTNPGGAFYNWYAKVYGTPPPTTVSPNSARYVAWTKGTPAAQAKNIKFGSVAT